MCSAGTASTTRFATSTSGRTRSRSRTRPSGSPAAAPSRPGTSAARWATTTPTLSFNGYVRGEALMQGFWNRLGEMGVEFNPFQGAFAQQVVVAETDDQAEQMYTEHLQYFFDKCLHVYPGFADAPGYRTENTIRAGLRAGGAQGLGIAHTLEWKDWVREGYHRRRLARLRHRADRSTRHQAPGRPPRHPAPLRRHARRQGPSLNKTLRRASHPPSQAHLGRLRRPLVPQTSRLRARSHPSPSPHP